MLELAVDHVTHAIEAGAEHLFGRQRADGTFGDDPPGSVLATAGAVLALRTAEPHSSAEHVAAGLDWLRRARNADGGWGGVAGAESIAVATCAALAALRIAAPDAVEPEVAAGRERLAAMGGVAAVTDPAVNAVCRLLLNLAGLLASEEVPRLPLEVVLSERDRLHRISFRTAPFVALALMQAAEAPSGAHTEAEAAARPVALGLLAAIHEHEGRTGEFSQDAWPAALVCLGLSRARLAPDLVTAIAGFLRRSIGTDGSWPAASNLDLTRSCYAATGLAAAGYVGDPRLLRTRELFHRTQQRRPFTVLDVPAGGWSFTNARGWPVQLESAEILSALSAFPDRDTDRALCTGLDWLAGRQDTRGSWSLWVRDTELPNDGPCPGLTSHGVIALVDGGRPEHRPVVESALAWLRTPQRPDGTFENLWYRDWTSGTALVLDAFAAAGRADDPVAGRARDWLLATQLADGSWGPGDGSAGSVEETAWALHALVSAGVPAGGEAARRGASWLLAAQRDDGDWPRARVCVYIRNDMHYPNGGVTRGLALKALAAYRDAAGRTP